jgi:peptidoglycan-associated lipoprotein
MRHGVGSNALRALWIPIATLLPLAGCPDKKPTYPTCGGDKDCREGEHCVGKKCVQCASDADCTAGQACRDNACVAKAGWCESDADCPDFKVCKQNQCVPCGADAACEGGTCRDGACIRPGQCIEDSDCADDEDCVNGRCTYQGSGGGRAGQASCVLTTVFFDFDASTLREDQRPQLEANAACLRQEGERAVYVVGHTDSLGTEEYNVALADSRARAVADFLARLGIDPARFHIVPKGEAEAAGTDERSWPQDRRVEFAWQ